MIKLSALLMNRRKTQVFISYRRDLGWGLAKAIYDALTRRGFITFLDVETLRSGPFNRAIFREIDAAVDVIVILSPGCFDRSRDDSTDEDFVRLELARAYEGKKNIVPVRMPRFDWPAHTLPADIAPIKDEEALEHSPQLFEASVDTLVSKYLHSKPRSWLIRHFWAWSVPLLGVGISFATLSWYAIDRSRYADPDVRPVLVTPEDLNEPWIRRGRIGVESRTHGTAPIADKTVASELELHSTELQDLERAQSVATKWNSAATPRSLSVVGSLHVFQMSDGPPQLEFVVVQRRYCFFAGESGLVVRVDVNGIESEQSTTSDAVLSIKPALLPWVISATDACRNALAAGGEPTKNLAPITLMTLDLKGEAVPVWIVPFRTARHGQVVLIHGVTGKVLDGLN